MMTEQQLQEIERLDARIECPDCGGMGTLGEIDSDMPEDKCQECDGTGDVTRYPYAATLIAEVRRLQAAVMDEATKADRWVTERDAALALLREVEFVNMNTDPIGTLLMCPICEGLPGRLGHAADCRLSALIKP